MPSTQTNPAPRPYTNPILRGGYPDPTICRVGDDYYLANSSFEYFPGLPIHHSRDLVNWELIGYGLHRETQCTGRMNLVDVQTRGGIHAPTLRHHQGTFYLITTNVYVPPGDGAETEFINFILTAADPAGPWSDPIIVAGAPGIDPDLFFDDDGRVWMLGTHAPARPNFPGEGEIWLQELHPADWQLTGPRHLLWRGACGGVWVEGPHLYRQDGGYYLLVAEGGTSFNHAVMVAVADEISGPYEPNPRNPILTARHLSYDNWVNSVGHADLVQLPDGGWMMVTLGIRGESDRTSNMGRETHLLPVAWEREPFAWKAVKHLWPVCSGDTGRLEQQYPAPLPTPGHSPVHSFVDDFQAPLLHPRWNFRRVPLPGCYSLSAYPGHLRLYARPEVIAERGRAAWLGFRQTESDFALTASLAFAPDVDGAEAGLCLLQQDDTWLAYTLLRRNGALQLRLVHAAPGRKPALLAQAPLPGYRGAIRLQVMADGSGYHYSFAHPEDAAQRPFAVSGADLILSRGYTGAYLGLYATGNGQETGAWADFAQVAYGGRPRRRPPE